MAHSNYVYTTADIGLLIQIAAKQDHTSNAWSLLGQSLILKCKANIADPSKGFDVTLVDARSLY